MHLASFEEVSKKEGERIEGIFFYFSFEEKGESSRESEEV